MSYTLSPILKNITDEDLDQVILNVQQEKLDRENYKDSLISISAVEEYISSVPLTIGSSGYNFSVTRDSIDGKWVNLDLDVANLSGTEKSFAIGALKQIVDIYNGKWVEENIKVRVSGGNAILHLKELHKLISLGD
jgi:hypothetical protein